MKALSEVAYALVARFHPLSLTPHAVKILAREWLDRSSAQGAVYPPVPLEMEATAFAPMGEAIATMKRRNFLSGLFAAPLALKARLARVFGRKRVELCNAPIGDLVLRMQPGVRPPQGQALLDLRDMWAASTPTPLDHYSFVTGLDHPTSDPSSAHCSLPRGHIGPHVLLNPR